MQGCEIDKISKKKMKFTKAYKMIRRRLNRSLKKELDNQMLFWKPKTAWENLEKFVGENVSNFRIKELFYRKIEQ